MDLALQNRTALVTGSHRGTGQIIAATLLKQGARVLVHGLTQEQAEAAVAELGQGIAVWGEITTLEGSQALLDQCAEYGIDILVNNFGAAGPSTWAQDDTGDQAWLDAYQKNVLSAQRIIDHILPRLSSLSFARIINLGTVGSTRPGANMPAYYAAKGALANMTIGLSRQVAGTAVRVNLVSPGLILTPEVEQQYLKLGIKKGWGTTWEEIEPHVAKDIPIGRITRREEVAALVAFLCSPLADAIHGQNIRIDGGQLGIVS